MEQLSGSEKVENLICLTLSGLKLTSHVYTTLRDLDVLVAAIEEIAAKEPPVKKKSE